MQKRVIRAKLLLECRLEPRPCRRAVRGAGGGIQCGTYVPVEQKESEAIVEYITEKTEKKSAG